ncbi:hypothetical protein FOA52_013839 [Chlamydomonas sp. UWO 241]|nr:hypothetical protein FOA52_013839 [Chlamydomonas sp. UWO 241]
MGSQASSQLPSHEKTHIHRAGAGPSRRAVSVASTGASAASPEASETGSSNSNWVLWLAAAAIVGGATYYYSTPAGVVLKEALVNSPLGRSGFLAAFSLIFLSELGDKTFFIAALLAMKLGKVVSFLGSVTSLSVMTVISVSIGALCSKVPDALKSSIPVGELAGILLLLVFGIKAIGEGLKPEQGVADEERQDAEESVKEAETSGKISSGPAATFAQSFVQASYLAETWRRRAGRSAAGRRRRLRSRSCRSPRSSSSQSGLGVAAGAIAGHAIATGIAVVGGAFASGYISEKTINLVSGVLFIVFAIASAAGLF